MSIKVGINGFGRIARVCIRTMARSYEDEVDVVAVNQRNADLDRMAYMLEYDSVFGRFEGRVEVMDDGLCVNGHRIKVISHNTLDDIDWRSCGAEYIIESTGVYTNMADCRKHIDIGGAKKVVLSAPGKDKDFPTFVCGVNLDMYDPSMEVVSNASCTTNCLAPLVKVINDSFGIKEGLMSTIHASTSKQKPVDSNGGRDWRTGRSVFNNIIPSTTGAAKAVGMVIPEMKGKLTGMSFRVPCNDCSVVDLTAKLNKKASYDEICAAIERASHTYMKGIIEYNTDELVSSDIRGNSHTCVFDKKAGIALNDDFVKLIAWYDNEWGYSSKLVSLIKHMAHADADAGLR
ncbi:MAG: type I glyceraldehyde-3-phosphate dehydrogenase [Parasporobacterium sp.]|nr:type I glyceraldehyde-3-phosphate dehydrogenase [Parasporobacterium sp.]